MWSLWTCEKTGKGSVTQSSVVPAKEILSPAHKPRMAEFLAVLVLWEGASVAAPWQGWAAGPAAGDVPCPCLCPEVWRPHSARGAQTQTKPSFLLTGTPRIAACKALSSFSLLMKPFFTLKGLLQRTKAHCCGQAWWDHGSKLAQSRAGSHSFHGSESRREAELECGSKWGPKPPTVAICNSYLSC